MTLRLANKVALITGTGGGQGRAAALLFAREGARIVGCDVRAEDDQETLRLVHAQGGQMVTRRVDLGDENEVREWIAFAVESFGDFDILYNNASACHYGKLDELSSESWHFIIRNELDLIYYAIKHAVPVLKRRGGGSIITTSSIAALTGASWGSVYQFAHGAAKAGAIAMNRSLAVELGSSGIRVNTISPGLIRTPVLDRMDPAMVDQMLSGILQSQPLKRYGQPEDIAYCALYLASDESSWVTGENFVVDGGLMAGTPSDSSKDRFKP
ncbi:MAG TPA: NAD(P)-dependent oxidoreductase [Betaproteobacteria bacterium]|nr:NAD(P)-dependent oxidoreductase [Betaproteobacteria bacterium]